MARRRTAKKMAKKAPSRATSLPVIQPHQVEQSILIVRGDKVLLDEQLASFYGVETRRLTEQVKRYSNRFPGDFMFQLSGDEWAALRSQNAISKPAGRGGRRYAPYAFTEQGVAMLSSVLRSPQAIAVNIEIMRAFVRLRQLISAHKRLADRIGKLEQQMQQRSAHVDEQIKQIVGLLNQLFNPPEPPRRLIGFQAEMQQQRGASKKAKTKP